MERPLISSRAAARVHIRGRAAHRAAKGCAHRFQLRFPAFPSFLSFFEIHRFVVIVDQAGDQNLLGFCGRYRFVGERVLCDPAAGRDRVLDLDESERFELVSISIESRLADTELA